MDAWIHRACVAALALSAPARAETVEEFYRGRAVTLTVAFPPGGGYDIYSRVLARYLPRHLPGNPGVVTRNMPGAGGIKAGNYMYSLAPRDGSALGMIADNSITEEIVGTPGVAYVTKNFGWIGRVMMSVNVTMVLADSPARTMADLRTRELVVGGTSAGGFTSVLHNVANLIGGTKFRNVYGYTASPESCLAMERGEVAGCTPSWTFVKTARREWLDPARARVLMQWGIGRHRELAGVPAMTELASTPADRKVLALFGSASDIGRSLVVPPGTPADRVAALRAAFIAAANDPELLEEVRKGGLDHDPLAGEDLQKIVAELGDVTPDIVARAKQAHDGQ